MLEVDPNAQALAIQGLAHLVQTALTPVFLLSGIASLLSVFATRLARVSDRSHTLSATLEHEPDAVRQARLEDELRFLRRRSQALDVAVLLATVAGGSTCAAALLLFVGSLRDATIAGLLYISFGVALVATAAALAAFMAEVLMASRGMRARQELARRDSAAKRGPQPPAAQEH